MSVTLCCGQTLSRINSSATSYCRTDVNTTLLKLINTEIEAGQVHFFQNSTPENGSIWRSGSHCLLAVSARQDGIFLHNRTAPASHRPSDGANVAEQLANSIFSHTHTHTRTHTSFIINDCADYLPATRLIRVYTIYTSSKRHISRLETILTFTKIS